MAIFHKERLSNEEAIVLRATPFREWDQILTLFGKERGLFSGFVPYGRSKRRALLPYMESGAHVEVALGDMNYEMVSIKEISPIDLHLGLRTHFDRLEGALSLVATLLTTQKPGQREPALFNLTKAFLKALEKSNQPKKLLAFFKLKLLAHEGHLNPQLHFSSFEAPLVERALFLKSSLALEELPTSDSLYGEIDRLMQLIYLS